jgi:two-component system, LuxR family, response regulator FixJ
MSAKDLVHIIDDDDALRDSLAFLLSSAGIEAKSYDSATAYLVDAQRGAIGVHRYRREDARHERH